MTVLPTDTNPYLQYIATGNFSTALPRYLRIEHFEAIRGGLDRLTLFHGTVEQAAEEHGAGGFDGFNLSDIFEYVSDVTSRVLVRRIAEARELGSQNRLLEYVRATPLSQ